MSGAGGWCEGSEGETHGTGRMVELGLISVLRMVQVVLARELEMVLVGMAKRVRRLMSIHTE